MFNYVALNDWSKNLIEVTTQRKCKPLLQSARISLYF